MNSEDINDAELDAFLKGEDALSGELQAMQQASPSAELDAAVLGRAEAQMARDSRPAAANDASDGSGPKAPLSRLGLRWRVPAGIAATVMAGVMAHQAWQASADMDRAGVMRIPAPAPQSVPATVEAEKPALAPAPIAAPPAPPARNKQPAPRGSLPVLAAPPVEAYAPEIAPPPPPLSYSSPPALAAAPASETASLARATSEASQKVAVSGRRSRVEPQQSSAAPAGQSGAMAVGAPDPAAWLAAIDELLKAGLRRDTLEEWDKFRAAYPDYPVPAETTDRISALRK